MGNNLKKPLPASPPPRTREKKPRKSYRPRVGGKEFEELHKRELITQLYMQGRSQWAIGRELGETQQNIQYHLTKAREEWAKKTAFNYEQARVEELAKIDNLEATAWEAYRRSCLNTRTRFREKQKALKPSQKWLKDQVRKAEKKARDGKDATPIPAYQRNKEAPLEMTIIKEVDRTTSESRGAGDPRFLVQIQVCIEMRCKIIGFIGPNVTNNTLNAVVVQNKANTVDWDAVQRDLDGDAAEAENLAAQDEKLMLASPTE